MVLLGQVCALSSWGVLNIFMLRKRQEKTNSPIRVNVTQQTHGRWHCEEHLWLQP